MVLGLGKKDSPLPLRPEPPNVQQMIEDVQGAQDDDIVFSVLRKKGGESMSSSVVEELSSDPVSSATLSSTGREVISTDKTDHDVENVYKQAVQFLELTKQLNEAPETLRRQCEKLVSAKKELTEAIDNLKKQSESVSHQ